VNAADARQAALDVLIRVEAGAASDRALDRALRRGELPTRERALATELVYGVLRRRQSIDRRLASHSGRPLERLDVAVLEALRLGAYQLDFLDRVPAHAAVGATVEAVKRHNRGASGFVNGVLRGLSRAGRSPRESATAEGFADVPDWWVERWRSRYGDADAGAWFSATLRPAPLVLRAHPRVADPGGLPATLAKQGIEVEAARYARAALRVVSGNPIASPLLRQGAFALRGEASQLVASLLPVEASGRVLDACAGRGGKTLQIAEDAGPRIIVANDVSPWRAAACRREARAAGVDEVRPVVADLSVPAPFGGRFSAVLVDAPCSGLGTVRRRPEIKWRNRPERLRRLAGLQRGILGHAADTLAEGGVLLYATCSTEPEENEDVVAAVVGGRNDLERHPVALPPGVEDRFVGADGYFRTYPHCTELDGFFAALVVKTG
jgi:16S rRNA (cytosine967-C5)-methyltransferase